MHSTVRRIWIAANDTDPRTVTPARPARRQSSRVDIGRRAAGEATTPSGAQPDTATEAAWFVTREPPWVDAQLWRVQAILGRLLR